MAIYMDGDLPRGASGIDWYESQMGPSFLLHGLARIALMVRDGRPCIFGGGLYGEVSGSYIEYFNGFDEGCANIIKIRDELISLGIAP